MPSMWPVDLGWVELMSKRGVLPHAARSALAYTCGTTEFPAPPWDAEIGHVQHKLKECGSRAQGLWFSRAGYSTWRGRDEREQVRAFARCPRDAPGGALVLAVRVRPPAATA